MWRNYPVLGAAVAVLGQKKQTGRLGLPSTHCSLGASILSVVKLRLQVDKRNRHDMGVPDVHPREETKGNDGLSLPLQPRRVPSDAILRG